MSKLSAEEFLERARQVRELDADLGKQLRALYVDGGTLQQLVRAILDQRGDLQESLAKNLMVTEEAIRIAIGIQGQVLGMDTVLDLILNLMNSIGEEDEQQSESGGRVP